MKISRTQLLLVSIAVVVCGLTAGCSGGSKNLVGQWVYQGTAMQERWGDRWVEGTVEIKLLLAKDGKVEMEVKNKDGVADSIDGKWSYTKNLLVMERGEKSNNGFSVLKVVSCNDTQLTILTPNGRIYTLTKIPSA